MEEALMQPIKEIQIIMKKVIKNLNCKIKIYIYKFYLFNQKIKIKKIKSKTLFFIN